jgi:predicted DNA-binding antitoxin AbrB/MazE fold protein
MTTIEAIYESGVFKPIGPIALAEKQRVRLRVDPIHQEDTLGRIAATRAARRRWIAERGALPDTTADIADDRRCDI